MSERGRGDEKSDVGEPPTSPVRSSSKTDATAPGTESTSIGISSLSLVDKKGPLTPSTPTTIDLVTTRTEPERSSEQGRGEDTSPPKQPRQVIAVSVSKGPSAFFNLARKFLVTDEECDLSALEGAIVSAVDAAHLLERSKIATIVNINTSYVTVEPKKRREYRPPSSVSEEASGSPRIETGATSATARARSRQPQAIDSSLSVAAGPGRLDQPGPSPMDSSTAASSGKPKSSAGTLRRARIVITVKRTEAYKKWLEDNPIQDVHAGQDDDQI